MTQITKILDDYFKGNKSLEDTLIECETIKKSYDEQLKLLSDFKSELLEDIDALKSEYPDGYKGYTFEVRNGGMMYSYKDIPEWIEAKSHLKGIEDKYKSFALSAMKGAEFDCELPEISYRKSSVIIKKT